MWRRIEKLSAIAILTLTALAVLYTVRSYEKDPVQLAITGLVQGSEVSGEFTVVCEVRGRPYDYALVSLVSASDPATELMSWGGGPLTLNTRTLNDGPHSVIARAFRGKRTVAREEISFIVDNTPPSITILSPASELVVSSQLRVDARSADAVGEPQVLLDGAIRLTAATLETDTLAEGFHQLSFSCADRAGNSVTELVPFYVDRTPPLISSLGVDDSESVSGAVVIEPSIAEANPRRTDWYLDGVIVSSEERYTMDTTTLPDGSHDVRLEVEDAVGFTASESCTVLVDNTSPAFDWNMKSRETVKLPPHARVHLTPILVGRNVSSRSDELAFSYTVNGKDSAPLLLMSDYEVGEPNLVQITATDLAGNSASISIKVVSSRSGLALIDRLLYKRPYVFIDGTGERPSPLVLGGSFCCGFPLAFGVQVPPYATSLIRAAFGVELPLGFFYIAGPVAIESGPALGAGARLRVANLEGVSWSSKNRRIAIDLGVAPVLLAPIELLVAREEKRTGSVPTHVQRELRGWLEIGVLSPLVEIHDSDQLMMTASMRFALGYSVIQNRTIRVDWVAERMWPSMENVAHSSCFHVVVGFETSFRL